MPVVINGVSAIVEHLAEFEHLLCESAGGVVGSRDRVWYGENVETHCFLDLAEVRLYVFVYCSLLRRAQQFANLT